MLYPRRFLIFGLLAATLCGPAHARMLPAGAQLCQSKAAILSYLDAEKKGSAAQAPRALERLCYRTLTAVNVEKLSCEGYVCLVKIHKAGKQKSTDAYTLRRYQP